MIKSEFFANREISLCVSAILIPAGSVAITNANNKNVGSLIIPANATNTFMIQNTGL